MDNVRQDGDKYRKKEDVYLKFPAILKEKLQSGEIHFPEKTHFEYQPIRAYRGIAREEEDDTPVNINDFRSYAEMGKKKSLMNVYLLPILCPVSHSCAQV